MGVNLHGKNKEFDRAEIWRIDGYRGHWDEDQKWPCDLAVQMLLRERVPYIVSKSAIGKDKILRAPAWKSKKYRGTPFWPAGGRKASGAKEGRQYRVGL